MKTVLKHYLNLLDLEPIDANRFRGNSQDLGMPNVFGGQVLGQALAAAGRTVAGRLCHSLHAYFLRPGDASLPIEYEVDRIRDGRSFTTRRVVALQNGRAIFNLAASFQVDEAGLEHQSSMPSGVPGPEGITSELELRKRIAHLIPEATKEIILGDRPIEIRPVDPVDYVEPDPRPPFKYSWFRAVDRLPDDPALHRCVLAYASDFGLLSTCMLPHSVTFFQPAVRAASLDHALWFHREFRADEWLLYAMESPSAAHTRGLNRAQIFTRDGRLVASVCQEGLVRVRKS